MTASVIAAHADWAELALFVWVLANPGGMPIPVVPALLGAGALAGSGSRSVVVTLAVSVAAALCADLTWYLLGRWRGSRALDLLTRLVPKARTYVQCASHLLRAHPRLFQLSARFLPEMNPIAGGLAGAAGMSVSRFLPGAAVSVAVWAGSWIGIGYLLTHDVAGLAWSVGIPLTFVGIVTLVSWLLLRRAQRRLLLDPPGRGRAHGGDDAEAAATAGAGQGIEVEHAAHERGPRPRAWGGDAGAGGGIGGVGIRGGAAVADDVPAPARMRGEHAMVEHQVDGRPRRDRGELVQEFDGGRGWWSWRPGPRRALTSRTTTSTYARRLRPRWPPNPPPPPPLPAPRPDRSLPSPPVNKAWPPLVYCGCNAPVGTIP